MFRSTTQWKTWCAFKRFFQNMWFQLGGGGGSHLNTKIVREVWRLYVGSCSDYFVKVVGVASELRIFELFRSSRMHVKEIQILLIIC